MGPKKMWGRIHFTRGRLSNPCADRQGRNRRRHNLVRLHGHRYFPVISRQVRNDDPPRSCA